METPVPRAAATAVWLDKALIEQEQEWSCRRDPLWLGLRSNGAVPRMIKYLRTQKGGLGGELILMALSSFLSPTCCLTRSDWRP